MFSQFRVLLLAYAVRLPLLSYIRNAAALAVNRTIDDEIGDSVTGALPIYVPQNIWTQGNQCTTCWADPDYQQTFDQSELLPFNPHPHHSRSSRTDLTSFQPGTMPQPPVQS
jgi:hypothetical protein